MELWSFGATLGFQLFLPKPPLSYTQHPWVPNFHPKVKQIGVLKGA